jgi:Rps23 Pro-64 3,4-dihydroxylase Tpa1-like proline 4-hydroxylase|tara:strand:+ start:352 stop:927 length:576 start_codon:yes stop_codon:yes gene_type:complete
MIWSKQIMTFPQVIQPQTVSVLIRYMKKISFENASVGPVANTVNKKIRNVSKFTLNPFEGDFTQSHWANFLNYTIKNFMNEYIAQKNLKEFVGPVFHCNQIELLKYEEGNFYKPHVDGGVGFNRTLSAILFLNNDYEGGELSFKNIQTEKEEHVNLKGKPGDLVIWPSNFHYPHGVMPVQKGRRYTVVAWA